MRLEKAQNLKLKREIMEIPKTIAVENADRREILTIESKGEEKL